MKISSLLIMLVLFGVVNVYGKEQDINKTLENAVLKHIQYEDAPINKVIFDLRNRLKKMSGFQKNLNIILSLSKNKKPENYTVTIELDNIPLNHALRYITQCAGLGYFVRDKVVVIADKNVARGKMEVRVFKVRPSNGFIKKLDKKKIKKGFDDMGNDIDFFGE